MWLQQKVKATRKVKPTLRSVPVRQYVGWMRRREQASKCDHQVDWSLDHPGCSHRQTLMPFVVIKQGTKAGTVLVLRRDVRMREIIVNCLNQLESHEPGNLQCFACTPSRVWCGGDCKSTMMK
jgi:hypothetical protein